MSKGDDFELQVRDIARALWEAVPGDAGADYIDEHERDLVYDTGFVTHYMEMTTERRVAKVRKDIPKMLAYRDKYSVAGHSVVLWYITKQEPTADQRRLCDQNKISALSLKEFRRLLFDGSTYMELRPKYPYGSARDPKTDSTDVSGVRYQAHRFFDSESTIECSIDQVAARVATGEVIAIIGDYGMGKSMAVREIFQRLRRSYLRSQFDKKAPVAVNLRECWNLRRPSEILSRHAEDVGLSTGTGLIRGFNGSQLVMLLDGFDEVVGRSLTRDRDKLRELRGQALVGVREFVDRSRGKNGVLITGRDHFFDDLAELRTCLGLRSSDTILKIREFDDEDAEEYLRQTTGKSISLPGWMPRRPLLLATFAARGQLDELSGSIETFEPARAWLDFLDSVCSREARIHPSLEPGAIKSILVRLATLVRGSESGIGPISESDIIGAFDAVGVVLEAANLPLLTRLPGLSARDVGPGLRSFIDDQFLQVLHGIAVGRAVVAAATSSTVPNWKHGIDELAASVAASISRDHHIATPSPLLKLAKRATTAAPTLALDYVQTARFLSGGDELDCGGLAVFDGYTPALDLTNTALPLNLTLEECTIDYLAVVHREIAGLRITKSLVSRLDGAIRMEHVPRYLERDCEVGAFDPLETSASMLRNNALPLAVRVGLTVLRKLYRQRGAGRMESALYRGMGTAAQALVPEVLQVVQAQGFATSVVRSARRSWHPVSASRARALRLLDSLGSVDDDFISKLRSL